MEKPIIAAIIVIVMISMLVVASVLLFEGLEKSAATKTIVTDTNVSFVGGYATLDNAHCYQIDEVIR